MKNSTRDPLLPVVAGLAVLFCALLIGTGGAEEKKPDTSKEPPKIIMAVPLAVARGGGAKVTLRGLRLDTTTEVRAEAHGDAVAVRIKSKGKAEVPKDAPVDKMGNTQVEIEFDAPTSAAAGEISFVAVNPNGAAAPHTLRLYDSSELTAEKEPNGGFQNAQSLTNSITVQGVIEKENDVDVFRITGKQGKKVVAEVIAARLGSVLDSLLTLYDQHGHVVASNDDTDTTDSFLDVTLPANGTFFLSVTDANGKGGAMYPYLLRVKLE